MQTITHFEVYQASLGQWTMVARFTAGEQDLALAHARSIEEDEKRPAAVIEEIEDLGGSQSDARLIHRSLTTGADIRPPPNGSDLGSRFMMIALNGVAIGVVAVVVGMVALSKAGLSSSLYNLAVLGCFIGGSLLGGLALFRVYIPVGVILWRSKDAESRKRTIMALSQGRATSAVNDYENQPRAPVHQAPRPAPAPAPPPAPAPVISGFDMQQTPPPPDLHAEASAPAAEETVAPADAVAAAPEAPTSAAAVSNEVMAAVVERSKGMLNMFTDDSVATLRPTRPNLTPGDRLGFSLYVLGAAKAVAERNALDEPTMRHIAEAALSRSRMMPDEIGVFFADVDMNGDRPRYKSMIDNGHTGIGFMLGDVAGVRPLITELLSKWGDPQSQVSEAQQVTFLLTDIVGSTALTSEIGNAGAQRVVRAHNAICRAAAKAFRGREVKHTGDGMLMIFPDSTSGARAAIDIQQEGSNFAADNPTAPLVMRVGVHTGEAVLEEGEYFGPAVATVNGVAGIANNGEICISAAVRHKLPTLLKAEDIGVRTVKGSAEPLQLFKLLWEAKRAVGKAPVLEYRQIGGAPTPGGDRR